jgi:hypothetical protein
VSCVIGDKLALNVVLAIAEEATCSQFETTYNSLDTLKMGQVTELPAHAAMYPCFPKPMLQGIFAMFGLLSEQGHFDFEPEKSSDSEVKTRKVKELVEEVWRGR